MKVLFRADASHALGTGHIVRCCTLAKALRRRGATVAFACRDGAESMGDYIKNIGFAVFAMPPARDEEADIAETVAIAERYQPDLVVVDHYGLGIAWERKIRSRVGRILAIDDLAARDHECDFLLDQNFSLSGDRYRGRVPESCRLLLGPRYALMGDEYAVAHARGLKDQAREPRILVSFGGSDPVDMTGRTLTMLSQPEFAELYVDVVTGASYREREALERATARRPRTVLHSSQPSLAPLMMSAGVAVGGGGITNWERCCLGVPALIVSVADNQIPGSRDLAAAGAAIYLGRSSEVREAEMKSALLDLLASPEKRAAMSEAGWRLTDGLGAARVAEAIDPTPATELRLRAATERDCTFVHFLANDPDVRSQSFQSDAIPWRDHQNWFAARISDPSCRLMVLEARDLPVGQIRFDRRAGGTFINYALDATVRGRGWGGLIVALGTKMLLQDGAVPIKAEVKPDNVASRAVFERLGFTPQSGDQGGKVTYSLDDPSILLETAAKI